MLPRQDDEIPMSQLKLSGGGTAKWKGIQVPLALMVPQAFTVPDFAMTNRCVSRLGSLWDDVRAQRRWDIRRITKDRINSLKSVYA